MLGPSAFWVLGLPMLFRDKLFCAVEVVVLFVRVTLGSLGILSWFDIKGVLGFRWWSVRFFSPVVACRMQWSDFVFCFVSLLIVTDTDVLRDYISTWGSEGTGVQDAVLCVCIFRLWRSVSGLTMLLFVSLLLLLLFWHPLLFPKRYEHVLWMWRMFLARSVNWRYITLQGRHYTQRRVSWGRHSTLNIELNVHTLNWNNLLCLLVELS